MEIAAGWQRAWTKIFIFKTDIAHSVLCSLDIFYVLYFFTFILDTQ